MRRRGCMTTLLIFVLLIIICCGAVWFVGIPRLRDQVSNELGDGLSTQVANQLGNTALQPGTQTLSVSQLQEQLRANIDTQSMNNLHLSVEGSSLNLSFDSSNQSISYSGTPTASNGKLKMENMKVDNDVLGFFMPADKLGDAIERGVNSYFEAQNLRIDSIQVGNDEITFTTSPQS